MFKSADMLILFVEDIDACAQWYGELFGSKVAYENPQFAFVQGPGLLLGFHPADHKNRGGTGNTLYWEVDDMAAAISQLEARGAKRYRGPMVTDLGAQAAMLLDPFGNTLGLQSHTPESRAALVAALG